LNVAIFWDIDLCTPYMNWRFGRMHTSIFRVKNQPIKKPACSRWLGNKLASQDTSYIGFRGCFYSHWLTALPCRLSAKLVPTFEDRGCYVVSMTDPYSRILGFSASSSSIVLTRLSGPCSRPTTSHKILYRWESNPDLWICSQELWPPDQRSGHWKLYCK
jgi:hypothetical protein